MSATVSCCACGGGCAIPARELGRLERLYDSPISGFGARTRHVRRWLAAVEVMPGHVPMRGAHV